MNSEATKVAESDKRGSSCGKRVRERKFGRRRGRNGMHSPVANTSIKHFGGNSLGVATALT